MAEAYEGGDLPHKSKGKMRDPTQLLHAQRA